VWSERLTQILLDPEIPSRANEIINVQLQGFPKTLSQLLAASTKSKKTGSGYGNDV